MKLYLSLFLVASVVFEHVAADAVADPEAAPEASPDGAHGGRRAGRQGRQRRPGAAARLRNGRQQQFAQLANQPLGLPPQAPILLDPVSPLPIQAAVPAAAPRSGRAGLPVAPANPFPQNPRGGRQFDVGSDSSTFSGNTPDDSGNYNFQFATDDGSFRQESGRQNGDAQEITGEVSWTDEVTGETISFTYVADENGYSAQGSHVPQPAPLSPAIQRQLDFIARANNL